MYFWYIYIFLILSLKSSLAAIVNVYYSTRNLYILGENTSINCSRIIIVHVHATVFSKVHPACHNIANGIKPESNSERLISMLRIAQKLYVGAKSDICEMIKLFIQQWPNLIKKTFLFI